MANWYDMLKDAMELNGDRFEDRICTLSEDELKIEFDGSWGGSETAIPFVAWGETYVYFPLKYDGKMSVGRAPRDPSYSAEGKLQTEPMEHQGCG